MPETNHRPTLVPRERMRVFDDTADGGLKVGVAVDAESLGSPLAFGLKWIRPGTERVSWQADDASHESYYVHQGSLRITWEGTETGETVVASGQCFYLPPATAYSIENVGADDVFAVWASTR